MPAMLSVLRQLSHRVAEIRRQTTDIERSMRALTAKVESDAPFARLKPDRRKTDRRT